MTEQTKLRDKIVLACRKGLLDRIYTLQEIGDVLGVTRERVRQIEERAKSKGYLKTNK